MNLPWWCRALILVALAYSGAQVWMFLGAWWGIACVASFGTVFLAVTIAPDRAIEWSRRHQIADFALTGTFLALVIEFCTRRPLLIVVCITLVLLALREPLARRKRRARA